MFFWFSFDKSMKEKKIEKKYLKKRKKVFHRQKFSLIFFLKGIIGNELKTEQRYAICKESIQKSGKRKKRTNFRN